MDKKVSRLRRAKQTRRKLAELGANRLIVYRSNLHIYANIIDSNAKVLASSSSMQKDVKDLFSTNQLTNGGNTRAAVLIGQEIAKKALQLGIQAVSFDRSGFRYHGRIKALADDAREAGLKI